MNYTTNFAEEKTIALERRDTLKDAVERIKEHAVQTASLAYKLRKDFFGTNEGEAKTLTPATCLRDDLEGIASILSECHAILEEINARTL